MKKILVTAMAAVLALCFFGCAQKESDTFVVGMECDYAPFNWTQSSENERTYPIQSGGYADGYDVQMAKLVAEGLGKKLVIVKTEWSGLTLAVQSGKIDAIIAGMSPMEDRKVSIDFSDPYYTSELVVVVKKDGPYAKAASLADLSGAKITGQLNTFHYTVIDQIPGVKKETAMDTFPAMIVALQSGKIDGYVSERPGALSATAANPELSFVQFADDKGFQASEEDVAISVGLKKGSKLCDQINQILAGISVDKREQMMLDALNNQPLSQ